MGFTGRCLLFHGKINHHNGHAELRRQHAWTARFYESH
jgi:hypothetical protein